MEEQSDFKCHVLVKNGNDFVTDTENICSFDKIDNDTFDEITEQFV